MVQKSDDLHCFFGRKAFEGGHARARNSVANDTPQFRVGLLRSTDEIGSTTAQAVNAMAERAITAIDRAAFFNSEGLRNDKTRTAKQRNKAEATQHMDWLDYYRRADQELMG